MDVDQVINLYPRESDDEESRIFMLEDLERSGLVPEDLAAYPIESNAWGNVQGYCIPYLHNPGMYRIRYNRDSDKYVGPSGMTDIWLPPMLPLEKLIEAQEIWIVEGEKKAAKFYKTFGLPTIAIGGAWMFASSHRGMSQALLLPNLLKIIALNKRVKVIFDSDIRSKPDIQYAAKRFAHLTEQVHSVLQVCTVPSRLMITSAEGMPTIHTPKGVDDWLVLKPTAALTEIEALDDEKLNDSLTTALKNLGCHYSANNKLLHTERNYSIIISHIFKEALYVDEYHDLEYIDRDYCIHHGFDDIAIQILILMQEYVFVKAPKAIVRGGLQHALIKLPTRNKVAKFISELSWDGVPRLNTWASTMFTSSNQAADYMNEWGRLLISGMVQRIVNPGCKVDYAFILVGKQGIGKSSFFYDLGQIDNKNYYAEYTPSRNVGSDSEQRTQASLFKRNIVIDFSEGVLLQKYSSEEVKTLITRREDICRKMMQLDMAKYPRHCICVGTSNNDQLLHDASGSRRFIVLNVETIQRLTDELKHQLFAEAYARRAEFETEDWHLINAAIPELDSNVHYESAQQAYNSQFSYGNDIYENVINYIESDAEVPIYIPTNQKTYIKEHLDSIIANRLNYPQPMVAKEITKILRNGYQQCPYTFESTRKVLSKLKFPNEHMRLQYEEKKHASDKVVLFYMFTKKVKPNAK